MTLKRCLAGLLAAICALAPISAASAQQALPLRASVFLADRQPLFDMTPATRPGPAALGAASLFAGRAGGSLFAPAPPRQTGPRARASRPAARPIPTLPAGPLRQLERVRHLIAQAEAGRQGYDAVQHGAVRRPPRRPTEMTVAEIYDWIAQTPGQQHAIGRYQFIPATLKRLVKARGVSEQAVFTPRIQDHLADALLAEAGLNAFFRGDIGRHTFMNNLARIWAGLPTSSGKSYYHGIAGNKATMSWADFDAEMQQIFPG